MKSRKSFFFLHFIIFSYIYILSYSFNTTSSYSYSPNYSFFYLSNKNLQNISLSIWTKEYYDSNISKIFSDYSYFITTTKTGIISIIYNNQTLFSMDFKKKMFQTYFNQENGIKGDNDIFPMDGKLFTVKNDYGVENFREFTTPIRELVDKTPFSVWFCKDYSFMGDKKYSMIEIMNRNKYLDLDIDLYKTVFVDYTLVGNKNNEQVWNTMVTNVFFFGKNEDIVLDSKNSKIDENILIYENNNVFDEYMMDNFGNNFNDIIYIHGYNKNKKKYIKLYDYNTYIHIKQNNIIDNNFEEQYINGFLNNDDNIKNSFDYNSKIIYQFQPNFMFYYLFLSFIITCGLLIILNNFISNFFFHILAKVKNIFTKKEKTKGIYNNKENIIINNKVNHEEIFTKIKNYFEPKSKHRDSIRHIRVSIQKEIKSIKSNAHSNSTQDLTSELNKGFSLVPSIKSIIKINSKMLKDLKLSKEKQKSEVKHQTRLEKDFKEITLIKKRIFRNTIDVILKAKHKIDEQLYAIKIKKLTNPNEEQSVIAEAQNMKKIRSKHIVEYITCWLDSSVGNFNYLFNEKNKEPKKEIDEDIFASSLNISKIEEKDGFKSFISKEEIGNDHYIKQLYTKDYVSDDECTTNKKNTINIDKKYYQKKESKESIITNHNIKLNSYIDDSSIKNKKSENQKDISDLSIYFFIQMEFCQQMTLAQYIQDHSLTKIKNKVMYTFTYQLIKSLAKIHKKNIIHANINPENIFVINEDSIKIGDFSSAKDIELKFKKGKNKYAKNIHSQSYRNIMELNDNEEIETELREESLYSSPEQNKGKEVSKKSDIYSVGLVLYEMCECFPDEDKRKKKIKFLKKYKIVEDKLKKDYELQCNLILQMIEDDEDKRPSCEELLESKEMQNWKFSISEN